MRTPILDRACLNALMERISFNSHLGLRVTRVYRDGIGLECRIEPHKLNVLGTLHGGVTATLVDAAAGVAILGRLGGRLATTVELKVNYLRPVSEGKVHARARIVKMGRTLCFATVEVKDDHGRLVAQGSATYMVLES
ncbi:MAG: PaaI family thioesterase [Bryobacteraceae bacterium]